MAPPPVTPSPHRFVVKKPAPLPKTTLAQEQTPRPGQQFKATPRFTFSSTPRLTPAQSVPVSTPSVTRFATPARQLPEQEDVIEHGSFEGPIHDSIETFEADLEAGDSSDEYDISQRSPKRRRLPSSPDLEDPKDGYEPISIPTSTPMSRRPLPSTASRFLFSSTPLPPSTPHDPQNAQPFLKPPRFRPPDPAEQAHAEPLPEQFSPHRRGQKYLPGGLAAEVRDWLVNLESATPSTVGQKKGEWLVQIVVYEVRGGGTESMTLVRGRQVDRDGKEEITGGPGEVSIILAGEGVGAGLQRGGKVEIGSVVGIKGPAWEIVLEEVKWGVGVDWKVLAS